MLTTLCNYFIACWSGEPEKRPTIQEIVIKLQKTTHAENTNVDDSFEDQLFNGTLFL